MKYFTPVLMVYIFLFVSCQVMHEHENQEQDSIESHDEHNHENEDVKWQITAYSDEFELFAEADPFAIGQNTSILAHFTWLNDFKALKNASAKVQLKVDNQIVDDQKERPLREGIFRFNITPNKSGEGELKFIISIDQKEYTLEIQQIKVFSNHDDAIHWAESQEVSSSQATVFTKEQSWKLDFETQHIVSKPFGEIIKTTALSSPCVAGEVIISAKSNGIVDLKSHHITEGMQVKKGEELFVISGSELANNNSSVRYLEAKNNYEKALSNFERTEELAKDKIVTNKELLEAKNEYENTKVIFENLQKNFSSLGQMIYSPINGYIRNLKVGNGEYVEAGFPLLGITKNERLVLTADVQQKYASILPHVNDAIIKTIQNNKTYSLHELNGHILSYGKTTNSDNYLIPIAIEIDQVDEILAGSFVELYLKTNPKENSIVIPNSALLEEQNNFFVYVQLTPELFEKREIRVGATDGRETEVSQGLMANERVVTRGAIMIKLSQSTGALDAHSGHVH